jgi:hypothetical protein
MSSGEKESLTDGRSGVEWHCHDPMIRSEVMLRWMMPFAVAIFAAGFAVAADLPSPDNGPGATVYRKVAPRYREAEVRVEEEPDVLFTPYLPPHTPILPGSATLPGYYGSTHSYQYQGPYYGGPYVGYWDRLPYACGVYGYC